MSWYVIDAVDSAFERTKKCLLEPFDFWKWVKLTIIVLLIGGGASFNTGGGNYSFDESDASTFEDITAGSGDIFQGIFENIASNIVAYIIGIILLLIILALVFSYISSVMEFVLVKSLVSNDVRFWEYSRSFLGKGFGLFIFRLLIAIIFLIIVGIMSLPLFYFLISQGDADFGSTFAAGIIYFMLFLFIIIVIGIIGGIIGSFVNLSIPVSLYTGSSIFKAFSMVLKKFRQDWQQIVIYWLGRIVLIIAVGIVVGIVTLIVAAIALILLLIIDGALYLVLSALLPGSDMVVWIILAPVILIQIILLVLIIAFVGMPATLFLKYHMLTFLQMWCPDLEIPMFDRQEEYTMEDTAASS
ncbi:hypothetical protein V7O62_01485 [Methanolobus sp. ZRKC2]|uniref:DUF7544 domain-containing protein n=1 Tax=Methanolobus sp. ZRKC2 TaxID=3125783 RepID=UPI003252F3CF